jgi:hypothetical protein
MISSKMLRRLYQVSASENTPVYTQARCVVFGIMHIIHQRNDITLNYVYHDQREKQTNTHTHTHTHKTTKHTSKQKTSTTMIFYSKLEEGMCEQMTKFSVHVMVNTYVEYYKCQKVTSTHQAYLLKRCIGSGHLKVNRFVF